MKIRKSNISFNRWLMIIIGGIAALLFVMNVYASKWLVVIAAIGLTLGITNFGRQCPLMLSLHYILARLKKKINY
jgi:hypothetical protein